VAPNSAASYVEGEEGIEIEEDDDNSITIDFGSGPPFIGEFSRSTDRKYIFAWQDSYYKEHSEEGIEIRGGHREEGMGRVALLQNKKILWQVELQRPNDGAVANTGHAVVNDELFGLGLQGEFYLFSPRGVVILKKKFNANLHHCGVTDKGEIAWCSTVSSDDPEASDLLCVFNVSPLRLLLQTSEIIIGLKGVSFSKNKMKITDQDNQSYEFSIGDSIITDEEVRAKKIHAKMESNNPDDLL